MGAESAASIALPGAGAERMLRFVCFGRMRRSSSIVLSSSSTISRLSLSPGAFMASSFRQGESYRHRAPPSWTFSGMISPPILLT